MFLLLNYYMSFRERIQLNLLGPFLFVCDNAISPHRLLTCNVFILSAQGHELVTPVMECDPERFKL